MSPEQTTLLNLTDKPGRFNSEQAGQYLGFNTKEISLLVSNGMLKPLGKPRRNSVKYFAFVELKLLHDDPKWLSRATETIQTVWRSKNETE